MEQNSIKLSREQETHRKAPSPVHAAVASRCAHRRRRRRRGRGRRRQGDGPTKFRQPKLLTIIPTPAPYCLQETLSPLSVISLLLNHILSLLLLGAQEATKPGQRIGREDEAGSDERLATRHDAVATALLVLGTVGVERVLPALARQTEGQEGVVEHGALDLVRVLLHDREGLVDFAEAAVGHGVGFGYDRCHEAVWFLRVGEDWLDEGFETRVREVERFLAVWVALEGRDGVADDGVGCEVLGIVSLCFSTR